METLFVIRNTDGEYMQIDFDSARLTESWVPYSEASWFNDWDQNWFNEGRFEVVPVV